jgi:hypothetical protein
LVLLLETWPVFLEGNCKRRVLLHKIAGAGKVSL